MRRNEVFQNGKSFAEARFDGDFYRFAVRVGHQTAHTGKLFYLVDRTAGAGVRHHKYGVELVESALKFFGNVVRRLFPDGHDFFVSFVVGDKAFLEKVFHFKNVFFGGFKYFGFMRGHVHIEH